MSNKKDFSEVAKVGAILFAITAIAALILAVVNSVTAPVIEANTIKTQNEAMRDVLPNTESFEKIEYTNDADCVSEIYKGDENGYVAMVKPYGYGGEVNIAVGIDNELKVTGIHIISQSETAGLGANCEKKEWQEQFIGKTEHIEVKKGNAEGNQIDAISSATITSKAVTKGVNEALSAVKEMRGE